MSIERRGGTDVVGRLTEQKLKLSEEKRDGKQPKVIYRRSSLMETPLESPQKNTTTTTENGNGSPNGKVNGRELLDATKFAPFEPQVNGNGQVKEAKWNGHAKEVKVNGYLNGKDKSLNGRAQIRPEAHLPEEKVDILKGYGAAKTVKDLVQSSEEVDMFTKMVDAKYVKKDKDSTLETIAFGGGAKMSVIDRKNGNAMLTVPEGRGVQIFYLKDAAIEDAHPDAEGSEPAFNFVLPQEKDGRVKVITITKDGFSKRTLTEALNPTDKATVEIAKQLALHSERNAVVEERKQMGEKHIDPAGTTLPINKSTGIPRLETYPQ